MNASPSPITQDLVLLGGGHSHAIALQMWAMQPMEAVRVTLVSDKTHTPYSGMLPGHVAGFYDFDECHIDLRQLCQAAGAQFYLDEGIGLDLERQKLICRNHPAIAFDYLSLDIGSTPAAVNVPGAQDYAIPAKPVPQFLKQWDAIVEAIKIHPQPLSLGVVGGGAGGVELTISLLARLRQITPKVQHQLHLFQRGATLLPKHSPKVGRTFHRILQQQGVQLHVNCAVQGVEPIHSAPLKTSPAASPAASLATSPAASPAARGPGLAIHHAQGTEPCHHLFWVTNASAPTWLTESGLATNPQGFVLVGETLQSISHPSILAAGDIATLVNHPRPKAGVFAVRQGKPLFQNLQRLLQGQAPQPFIPQQELLALIGTGTGQAVASRGRWSLGPSKLLWQWKDRIDRKFMERFSQLAVMEPSHATQSLPLNRIPPSSSAIRSDLPSSLNQQDQKQLERLPAMYCSGCGAKVGSRILERTLNRLRDTFPNQILDNPDDAAVLKLPSNQALIQTVDYFTALVSDPFIFGQITTNHCLNDILAMGAQPHSVMALAQVPHGSDGCVEESLYQLLSGAMKVLAPNNIQLIGGHSMEGNELALGLSCNGLGQSEQLWRKGGIQPGQALILTKALGTGTLFAAAAQGKAKGRWIDAAIASMLQSNAPAIPILRNHQTTACTDVTGFGLLGHLGEMVKASRISIELNLLALPQLTGTTTTLAQGIVSSMERQNASAQRWVSNWADGSKFFDSKQARIVFDPQTSGGLLVALPQEEAASCVEALRNQGYDHSEIIGHSLDTEDSPHIYLR